MRSRLLLRSWLSPLLGEVPGHGYEFRQAVDDGLIDACPLYAGQGVGAVRWGQ